MTSDDALFPFGLRAFALAELGSVRAACRLPGIYPSTFYRWRRQALRFGLEMLRPRERRRPRMPNATAPFIEQRVVAFALGRPGFGAARIAAELARAQRGGIRLSANGVWRVLRRHGSNPLKSALACRGSPRAAPPVASPCPPRDVTGLSESVARRVSSAGGRPLSAGGFRRACANVPVMVSRNCHRDERWWPARMRRMVMLAALTAVLVAAGACRTGPDDDVPPDVTRPTANTATSGVSATSVPETATAPAPTIAATAVPAEERRTGIPELDRVIEAVDQRDRETLAGLVEYQVVACTTELGAGGPPKCPPGTPAGTPLTVFPVVSCEGGWTEDAEQTLDVFMDAARGLYAAAESPRIPSVGDEWPEADALLIFHLQQPYGEAAGRLHLSAGRIVAVWYSCSPGSPPSVLLEVGGEDAPLIAGPWAAPEAG